MSSHYFIPLGLVVLVAATLVFAGKARAADSAKKQSGKGSSPIEAYHSLRNRALTVRPDDLGITTKPGELQAYGVVLDLPLTLGSATIVSFSTGDTSMYTSTGGGVIGGFGHESCRLASQKFVKVAQRYLGKMTKTTQFPLPPKGTFRFYVVTNQGVFMAEDSETALTAWTSELSPLFFAGNDVMTQLRLISSGK
jgi:hypothetical protein